MPTKVHHFTSKNVIKTTFQREFSSKGFEKPHSADYEGRPDVRIVSMVSLNH